jgi:hypothetical protein
LPQEKPQASQNARALVLPDLPGEEAPSGWLTTMYYDFIAFPDAEVPRGRSDFPARACHLCQPNQQDCQYVAILASDGQTLVSGRRGQALL